MYRNVLITAVQNTVGWFMPGTGTNEDRNSLYVDADSCPVRVHDTGFTVYSQPRGRVTRRQPAGGTYSSSTGLLIELWESPAKYIRRPVTG